MGQRKGIIQTIGIACPSFHLDRYKHLDLLNISRSSSTTSGLKKTDKKLDSQPWSICSTICFQKNKGLKIIILQFLKYIGKTVDILLLNKEAQGWSVDCENIDWLVG